jgi:hypothetical protein
MSTTTNRIAAGVTAAYLLDLTRRPAPAQAPAPARGGVPYDEPQLAGWDAAQRWSQARGALGRSRRDCRGEKRVSTSGRPGTAATGRAARRTGPAAGGFAQ